MSDREAFVSAIAASPADDLPRLVFADWLDEHGEPDRAEFIRTQIRWHQADGDELGQLGQRIADLFREHGKRWLAPFVLPLHPAADLDRHYLLVGVPTAADPVYLEPSLRAPPGTAVRQVSVSRGFVSAVTLDVKEWASEASLVEAFRHESPRVLTCRNGLYSPYWRRFTDPTLRRIERLTIAQEPISNDFSSECIAFLDDPHLAGVREFALKLIVYAWDEYSTDTRPDPDPLPVTWLNYFARSPLAYRLSGLELPGMNEDSVRALCSSDRLRLERLSLGGELNTECVRLLERNGFAETVRELELNETQFGDAGIAALARGNWQKLTALKVRDNGLSATVLPALTSAVFTPQLTDLDLSENRFFFNQPADLTGLRALAEVLDPDRLVHLNLTNTGLAAVPDFLAERFGDRVTV